MSRPIIVVTGATGMTGKLLVKQLAGREDVHVRAAVRSLEKARCLLPGVELVEMDYERPDTVSAAMRAASRLYLVTPGGSGQMEQTWIAVEAARAAGVERIVRLGSLQSGHTPPCQVERWCAMTEQMVARSGLAWTFLRPTWYDQDFIEYIFAAQVKMGLLLAPIGEGRAGWIDCRDIAAVAAAALTEEGHQGKAYTLTGPELVGMREIMPMLSHAAGRTIRYYDTPELPQRILARVAGFSKRDVNAMMELLGKLKAGHLTHVTDDVERVLGRRPISFAQFAQDYAQALRR